MGSEKVYGSELSQLMYMHVIFRCITVHYYNAVYNITAALSWCTQGMYSVELQLLSIVVSFSLADYNINCLLLQLTDTLHYYITMTI